MIRRSVKEIEVEGVDPEFWTSVWDLWGLLEGVLANCVLHLEVSSGLLGVYFL